MSVDKNGDSEVPGRPAHPLVVGIGASAGGLEAFQVLLSELGNRPGFAIVFCRDPEIGGLEQASGRVAEWTGMPVVEVSDSMALEPNVVYMAPPHAAICFSGGRIRFAAARERALGGGPIDSFLHSLAGEQGSRAVGVILSGMGSDGTVGLRAIRDAGGITFAQDSGTALQDGMPRSAASLGLADHVLPPGQIARELILYARHFGEISPPAQSARLQDQIESSIPEIRQLLLQVSGHDLRHSRTLTLARRIRRRMQVLKLRSTGEYLEMLKAGPGEPQRLFRELWIGATAFFPDPEAYERLAALALDRIVGDRRPNGQVRIWVPGCATGEEAYTLAMLCCEQLDRLPHRLEVRIFATDMDDRALKVARHGAYPIGIGEELTPERVRRFFVRRGETLHVAREIRELVLFSPHDLISDPPFAHQDLISFRNLMIDRGPQLQKKLIPLFHHALRPSGFLFLGPAENTASHPDLFRTLDARHGIFQRRTTGIEGTDSDSLPQRGQWSAPGIGFPDLGTDPSPDLVQVMHRMVLDEFAPKSVIVDGDGQVLCASSDMEKYLSVGEGTCGNSIVRMARSGLRTGLRGALKKAAETRCKTVVGDLSVRYRGKIQQVQLTVQPIPRPGEAPQQFLVVFQDLGLPFGPAGEAVAADGRIPVTEDAESLILQLERELDSTRTGPEATIPEMESTNEKLKPTNEELLSMNEKLPSTNEGLESSREEIQAGVDALSLSNADLKNLLQSNRIAMVFVDRNGITQWYSPAAAQIYNLVPSDIGRPLDSITHNLAWMPSLPDLLQVEAGSRPETELRAVDGRWYSRRVHPYLRGDQADGMIISFIDVSEQKKAAALLATQHLVTRILLDAGSFRAVSLAVLDSIRTALHLAFCALWLADDRNETLVCAETSVSPDLPQLAEFELESRQFRFGPGIGLPGKVWKTRSPQWIEDLSANTDFVRKHLPGAKKHFASAVCIPVLLGDSLFGVIELYTSRRAPFDQTTLEMLQAVGIEIGQCLQSNRQVEQLRIQEARMSAILESALDAVITMDVEGRIVDFNPAAERTFGYSREAVSGKTVAETIIPPELQEAHASGLRRFLQTGRTSVIGQRVEMTALHADGRRFPVEVAINAASTCDGSPFFTAHLRDITDRQTWQRQIAEGEAQLRRVLDNILGFVGLLATDGTLLEISANSLAQAGLVPSDVMGRKFWDCHWWNHDPETVRDLKLAVARAAAGETVRYDVVLRMAGDSRITADFMLAPVRDSSGSVVHLVPSGFDISARKQAELALLDRRSQFETLVDATSQIVWTTDAAGIIQDDSPSWRAFTGQSPEDWLGNRWLDMIHPDDREKTRDVWKETTAGTAPLSFEYRLRHVSGDWRWTHFRAVPQIGTGGRVLRWIGMNTDITASKQRELALAFEAALAHELTAISSIDEVLKTACSRLAGYLGLSHCLIASVDPGTWVAEVCFDHASEGVQPLSGSCRLEDFFTDAERKRVKEGRTVVIDDTADPGRPSGPSACFADPRAGALIAASCSQPGKPAFVLAGLKPRPCQWQPAEVNLLQSFAPHLHLSIERARAEAAQAETAATLARNEAHLRRVINNQLGLVGVIDRHGVLLEVDDQSIGIAGLTREDVIGRHFADCAWWTYDPAVSARMRKSMERAFAGETVRFDVPLYAKGDRRVMIDFMIAPVRNDQGDIEYLIPSGVDISERVKVEEESRAAAGRLEAIFNTAVDGIITIDSSGTINSANPAAVRIFGYAADQMLGRNVKMLMPEPFHGEHDSYLSAFLATRIPKIIGVGREVRGRRRDGSTFPLGLAVSETTLRGKHRFVGIVRDISDQKRAEEKIRESEVRLAMALKAGGMAAWEWRPDSCFWTDELFELIGIPPRDAPTMELLCQYIHPEDRRAWRDAWQRAVHGTDSFEHEFRILRPDGQVRWLIGVGHTVEDPNGRVTRIFGLNWDSTQDHLHTEALRLSERKAKEASLAKSEFLANMSHEIRTPMTAVLGYADLLLTQISDPECVEHLRIIRRNGQFLLEIINDILDLSKIEAGKLEIDRTRFAVHKVVRDIVAMMQVRADEKGLEFSVGYDGPIPATIDTDSRRLKQILVNLIGNAIKFTETGGVRMGIRFLEGKEPKIQFEISDTGIGMSRPQLERLFIPFSQGDASVSRSFGGTGLGLAISRRLASILGGDVTVSSEPKKGSTFVCTIAAGDVRNVEFIRPRQESVMDSVDGHPAAGRLDCRVLVVDDRRDVRLLTRTFLLRAGASVELAEDGQFAIERIQAAIDGREPPVDLILLDMQMPRMDGYQTAAELRNMGFRNPIIALTADAMHGDMKRCIDCGCNAYLSKPIDSSQLIQTVRLNTAP